MVQKVTRRVKVKKTPLIVVLLMILVVLGLLTVQFFSFYNQKKSAPPNIGLTGMSQPPPSSLPISEQETESVSEEKPNISSQAPKSTKEIKVDTIVPETVAVGDEYFKDALFIGDSISKGFKLWVSKYPKNVIADQNVGLDQIYQDKAVYYVTSKEKTTLWDAIDQSLPNPAKIYVLLGTNGIPGFENDRHIIFYRDLIDKLKKKFPDAVIYIESVTPITQEVSKKRAPSFTSEKINAFNKLVLEMAKDKGIYYLKIEDVLMDKNGFLNSAYDGGDGTHMPKEGHMAIYDYLKKHTASKDGFATVYGGE